MAVAGQLQQREYFWLAAHGGTGSCWTRQSLSHQIQHGLLISQLHRHCPRRLWG